MPSESSASESMSPDGKSGSTEPQWSPYPYVVQWWEYTFVPAQVIEITNVAVCNMRREVEDMLLP